MKRIITAATVVAALLACGMPADTDPGPATGPVPVVFEVTGPASADITWGVSGGTTQDLGATLPWRRETTAPKPVIAVVVAQSKGAGDITCKLTIDGVAQPPKTSTGQFAVVTCGGT